MLRFTFTPLRRSIHSISRLPLEYTRTKKRKKNCDMMKSSRVKTTTSSGGKANIITLSSVDRLCSIQFTWIKLSFCTIILELIISHAEFQKHIRHEEDAGRLKWKLCDFLHSIETSKSLCCCYRKFSKFSKKSTKFQRKTLKMCHSSIIKNLQNLFTNKSLTIN